MLYFSSNVKSSFPRQTSARLFARYHTYSSSVLNQSSCYDLCRHHVVLCVVVPDVYRHHA
jgi:hypothetical protein